MVCRDGAGVLVTRPSREAAAYGAAVLRAMARAGCLGSDPMLLVALRDLCEYVERDDDVKDATANPKNTEDPA